MVNPELLLFIEPEKPPSKEPLIDELTRKMTASFRKSQKGSINDYSKPGKGYNFIIDGGWFGPHRCSCGVISGGRDYLLLNGEMTNENCIHYLAYHRNEILNEQIDRVSILDDGEESPSVEELKTPSSSQEKKKALPRQKYLENHGIR